MLTNRLMGAAGAEKVFVEDVFSTYLYTGNGSNQTINNGIDLAGKGGLVWIKSRSQSNIHVVLDSARGPVNSLTTNSALAQNYDFYAGNTTFNSNGITLSYHNPYNDNGSTYASWTFRKAPKFFDVVTYTGNGGSQTINHSLGVTPGMVIIKRTDNTSDWVVWHRSFSLANTAQGMRLNTTDAFGNQTGAAVWGSTSPMTATTFSVAASSAGTWNTNLSGASYVAYLFAHDTTADGLIQCGSFTTDGTGASSLVTLGYEPQYILFKSLTATDANQGAWQIVDSMRGLNSGATVPNEPVLFPNNSNAETAWPLISVSPTGFQATNQGYLAPSSTFIYMAIRRGPMKTPTSGASVFGLTSSTGDISIGAVQPSSDSLPWSRIQDVDMVLGAQRSGNAKNFQIADLLRGFQSATTQLQSTATTPTLSTSSVGAETTTGNFFFRRTGLSGYPDFIQGGSSVEAWAAYRFKRAPGFFDVVCYTGDGGGSTPYAHNLKVAPELIIIKSRSVASTLWVTQFWVSGIPYSGYLNQPDALSYNNNVLSGGVPTDSVFYTRATGNPSFNTSGATYIAYLFASCPGVSKVGSYTGTGTTKQIDCGFTTGARFVLIKRTGSTGDWYTWDSARGIVSGNDPYLLMNSTAAENTSTDYIDPYAAGFEISSTAPAEINASGGTFIYLAIA